MSQEKTPASNGCRDKLLAFGLSVFAFTGIDAVVSGGDQGTTVMCLLMGVMTGIIVAVMAGPERAHFSGPFSVHSMEEPGPELQIACPRCGVETLATTSCLKERMHVFLIPVLRKTTKIVMCSACKGSFTSKVKLDRLATYTPDAAALVLTPWNSILPRSSASTRSVDPELTRLRQERPLLIAGELAEKSAQDVLAELLWLVNLDASKPVELRLESASCNPYLGLAIYSTLRELETPVRTRATGELDTLSTLLVAAGEPGHRSASKGTLFALGKVFSDGTSAEPETRQAEDTAKRVNRAVLEALAETTGREEDTLRSDLASGPLLLTAEEARAFGLIDHVAA